MNVKNINPIRPQLLQAVPQGHVQRPLVVAGVVDGFSFTQRVHGVIGREFGGYYHRVTIAFFLHPFSDPGFRFFLQRVSYQQTLLRCSTKKRWMCTF